MRAGKCAAAAVLVLAAVNAMNGTVNGTVSGRGPSLFDPSVPHLKAVEMALPSNPEDEAVLGRPVAMALARDRLLEDVLG